MSTADNNFNWDPLSRYLTTLGVHLFGGVVGPFVSPSNQGIIYYDRTSNRFKASENGGAPINLLTGGGGGSAYQFIQEEGTTLPQQDTMNFIGSAITAADAGTKTNITLSQSPAGSASVVGVGRLINTTAPITGGGDLSADRTIAMPVATSIANGYLSSADWSTFNAKVSTTRQIIAGTGLTGGGDLSADRTLSVVNDTTTQRIKVDNAGTLVGTREEINFIAGSNISYTIADNSGSNRVDITINSTGGGGGGSTSSNAQSQLAVGQTIPTGTDFFVPYGNLIFDTASFYSGGTPSRFTAPATGTYMCIVNSAFSANASGVLEVKVVVNHSPAGILGGIPIQFPQTAVGASGALSLSAMGQLTSGDFVEVDVVQNSGADITMTQGSFSIIRLA